MAAKRRPYEGTTVNESESLAAIETMLRQHGVKATRWTNAIDWLRIEFSWEWKGRPLNFRIDLEIPDVLDGYKLVGRYKEAERRRRLRVLLNHIKAKLVAVEDGLVDMEQEFMPYLLLGEETVGEMMKRQMPIAIEQGRMDALDLIPERLPR